MLLLGLGLLLAVLMFAMSQMLIAPTRMSDAKAVHLLKRLSPGDLGMWFEEVTFQVRDEQTGRPLIIAGWWIPVGKDDGEPPSGNTVVILHGFADAKVGAIAWAPLWRKLGYNILAIDLRAHGESGGKYTTAGYFERFDVDQVVNEIRAERPHQTREMVLFGISLGAAVAAAVAERRDDLKAIVLDSPYHHFTAAALLHGRYMNLPFGFLAPFAVRLGKWRSGANFDEVAPLAMLQRCKTRALLMFGEIDPLVDFTPFQMIAGDTLHIHRIPHAGHVLGIVANPGEYLQTVQKFLRETPSDRK